MTDESPPGSPPPPRALERPRSGVATSLASARPGEVVYSTRGGEVMTAGRVWSTKIWT